jgi:hypothetical protein
MARADAPFSIEDWDPHVLDDAEGTPALGRVRFRKTYRGDDLVGTAVAGFLNCGELAYAAVERITGTLAGRSGTFVLMHCAGAGSGGGDEAVASGYVVAGSGTGKLAGLTGRMKIEHGDDGPRLLLDYNLP